VADRFAPFAETSVTLLGIVREPSRDHFDKTEEWDRARMENEANIAELVERAKQVLAGAGLPNKAMNSKLIQVDKESVAAIIIEEQQQFK
jgi:hypothetical protein